LWLALKGKPPGHAEHLLDLAVSQRDDPNAVVLKGIHDLEDASAAKPCHVGTKNTGKLSLPRISDQPLQGRAVLVVAFAVVSILADDLVGAAKPGIRSSRCRSQASWSPVDIRV
jgi:hypothetical protein